MPPLSPVALSPPLANGVAAPGSGCWWVRPGRWYGGAGWGAVLRVGSGWAHRLDSAGRMSQCRRCLLLVCVRGWMCQARLRVGEGGGPQPCPVFLLCSTPNPSASLPKNGAASGTEWDGQMVFELLGWGMSWVSTMVPKLQQSSQWPKLGPCLGESRFIFLRGLLCPLSGTREVGEGFWVHMVRCRVGWLCPGGDRGGFVGEGVRLPYVSAQQWGVRLFSGPIFEGEFWNNFQTGFLILLRCSMVFQGILNIQGMIY